MHPALKQCKFEQDGSNHCISFWVWKKTKSSNLKITAKFFLFHPLKYDLKFNTRKHIHAI